MTTIPFIDLASQYQAYKTEIHAAIDAVLHSGQYIMGQEIDILEQNLAQYIGTPYAIACSSGTDALLLVLMALDIQPGDEVITTPFTFISTATMIQLLGAKPVFADIQADTYNIDPQKIAACITAKTRAIIPVALYGQPADMDEINAIAAHYSAHYGHQITVIEDAAQSFGATYHGKKSGHLSEVACTSFFPSKPLGAYGDGGAIFTTNAALAERMKVLRVHGQTARYHHEYLGINGRIDTLQAAILNVKLKYFPQEVEQRRLVAQRYESALVGVKNIVTPFIAADRTSIYAQYSIRVPNRQDVIEKLQSHHIPTAIHYPKPLHLQPCFEYLGYKSGDFPISECAATEVMSLPMSPFISPPTQEFIIDTLLGSI